MSYVEGIGDEVLISVAIVTIVMILLLLWSITEFTTNASQPALNNSQSPHFQHRRTSQERVNNANSSTERQSDQSQTTVVNEAQSNSPDPEVETAEVDTPTQDHVEHTDGTVESPNTTADLRQRRLDFFNKGNVEELQEPRQNCVTNGSVPSSSREASSEDGEQSSERHIQIRLKYLDDTERTVQALPMQIIQEFKRTHFADELANNRLVRLISTGYVLEESRTLQSYGLVEGSVIHVQIQTNHVNPRTPTNEAEGELDIGQFLYPILGVALLCVWIMHFQYREYFTTTATVALLILSGLFLTVVWGQHSTRTLNTPVQ